ncbi:MAG: hypothetical protein DME09_11365 [Candidatus Rokuibacteriota bacterium]|nr:MAG: hypothetical protein DME09_11365 [Candidatus Rokubacteria bacterium]
MRIAGQGRRWLCLTLLLLGLAAAPGVARAQAGRDPLAGTWRLASFDIVTSDGEVVDRVLGPHPTGALMYDGARMCVQLTRPDRPAFATNDILGGATDEKARAYESFIAYCGTYSLNEAEGVVVHHLEWSLFPNWAGTDQRRFFAIAGDRLTLTTPPFPRSGRQVTAKLVWERMR